MKRSKKARLKKLLRSCLVKMICFQCLFVLMFHVVLNCNTYTIYAEATGEPATKEPETTEPTTTESTTAEPTAAEPTTAGALNINAQAAVLMEVSTGNIMYEKEADVQLRPASITKIMTLILIFDALKEKQIDLTDVVVTSEHAASMGGSQVFLEVQEQQTVDTLIKCIAVASANDACVAMAEHISGTEEAFVAAMNERAKGLGMTNTHFVNCCGLDVDGHVTSAGDVALMSRELITKYPEIYNYSGIWMDKMVHTTSKGSSEFGLTNTNKMIKQYPYATGLKTGSTSLAKYCVSATAKKDNVELIAVIMAAPDYKVRFSDASALLNYGFANCFLYKDEQMPELEPQKVKGSLQASVKVECEEPFSYLSTKSENFEGIKRTIEMKELKAPVQKGQKVGVVKYTLDGKEIGTVDIVAIESVKKAGFSNCFLFLLKEMLI